MKDVVVIDANLLVLLIVGSTSPRYIANHKNLSHYTADDFEVIIRIVSRFEDIILIPHVLAETSNLLRQGVKEPAKTEIQATLKRLIETVFEVNVESLHGTTREEFFRLGLTDALLFFLCSMQREGFATTLLTADVDLSNAANSLGYSVINYQQDVLGQS